MLYLRAGFALIMALMANAGAATEIIKCLDKNGKLLFTDNRRLCQESTGTPAASVDVRVHNLHSQYGALVSEEYYNYAFRAYAPLDGYRLNIIAEKKLIDSDPELLSRAARKLERAVDVALLAFPASARPQFDEVRYFIFSGEESRSGGRRGGQWYFPRNNRTSPRFDNSIVIRSAKDYLRYSSKQAARTALHELSHAYYYYHYRRIGKSVRDAYNNAEKGGLYRNVATENGRTLNSAYATTNEREYFAELSKIYFLHNAYYPFRSLELEGYDPVGYRMIRDAFIQ